MSESLNKKELEAKVARYVDGQLSATEVDQLWTELIQDEDHLDYLKNMANLQAAVKQKKEKQKSRKYWYYSAAAVIALLIAVMAVLNYAVPNGAGVEPIAQVELNYYRSADGSYLEGTGSEVIRRAITLANTGKVGEAINLLQNELETAVEPEWVARLSLNLGSLYYNQAAFSKAIKHYSTVISNKQYIEVLMLEKAYWYIGNAYFHQEQLTKARINIEKAYDLNGAYRRVTKSYLMALS